jgi:hypothetical protein
LSKLLVRVYTDYRALLSISKQTILETTSTEYSNLQLVQASEYIQYFNLDIKYKPGKMYIVLDTLSQLAGTILLSTEAELDFATAYNYIAILVEISEEFRAQLLRGYSYNPIYQQIIEVLTKTILSIYRTELLYYLAVMIRD